MSVTKLMSAIHAMAALTNPASATTAKMLAASAPRERGRAHAVRLATLLEFARKHPSTPETLSRRQRIVDMLRAAGAKE